MITVGDKTTTIVCDKCGFISEADNDRYNIVFEFEMWSYNSYAKKYIHRCFGCLTSKQRRAKLFVNEKFRGL